VTTTWFEVVEVAASASESAVVVAVRALLAVVMALLTDAPGLLKAVEAFVEAFETLVRVRTPSFAVAFQYAPATWLTEAASATAIDCGVLVLPNGAEAVRPLVVSCTVPLSYFVVVPAVRPPVRVVPDGVTW